MKSFRIAAAIALAAVSLMAGEAAQAQTSDQDAYTAAQAQRSADVRHDQAWRDRHAADVQANNAARDQHAADVAGLDGNGRARRAYQHAADVRHIDSDRIEHAADVRRIQASRDSGFARHERTAAHNARRAGY